MKKTLLILVLALLSSTASARYVWGFAPVKTKIGPNGETLVLCVVENGDTMPCFEMKRLWFYPKRHFKNKRQERQYWRMVNDVKKALPVVYYIEGVIRDTNDTLMTMPTKKQRDKYMAHFEKRIYKQNYEAMSQLTLRQGMLVMRLLDRDIDQTSYELVKAYRGSFRAFFYQVFAKFCGADLKVKFGDGKNDGVYEEIINLVEAGEL